MSPFKNFLSLVLCHFLTVMLMESVVGTGHQKIMGLISSTSSPSPTEPFTETQQPEVAAWAVCRNSGSGQTHIRTSIPGKGRRKPVSHDKAHIQTPASYGTSWQDNVKQQWERTKEDPLLTLRYHMCTPPTLLLPSNRGHNSEKVKGGMWEE